MKGTCEMLKVLQSIGIVSSIYADCFDTLNALPVNYMCAVGTFSVTSTYLLQKNITFFEKQFACRLI